MLIVCGELTPWLSTIVAVRVATPTKPLTGWNTQLPALWVTVPWLAGTVTPEILIVSPATSLSAANIDELLMVKVPFSFIL